MSLSPAAIRRLAELGVSALDIADIAELNAPPVDVVAEKRRAFDRERKQAKRNSTGHSTGQPDDHSTGIPPETAALACVGDNNPSTEGHCSTSEANASAVSAGKVPKQRGSRHCPESWRPSEADLASVAELNFTAGELERELAKFRDHQFRDAHTNWGAALRNWLRRARERQPQTVIPLDDHRPHYPARPSPKLERLAAIDAAMRAAVRPGGA